MERYQVGYNWCKGKVQLNLSNFDQVLHNMLDKWKERGIKVVYERCKVRFSHSYVKHILHLTPRHIRT